MSSANDSPATSSLPPKPSGDRFVKHANLMSGLTIVSRVAGLVRDKTCSYFIGVSTVWTAFWMGFQIPNTFRRIFGEGALTAIFVPIYTRTLEKEGQEAASRLAAATCTTLVLLLSSITLVGELIAIPLAFLAADFNNRLAAGMTAVMLPYCMMVCLVAILGAVASVHERFAEQAISPIILNICWSLGAALPVVFFGNKYDTAHRAYWMAGAILLAGVIQVFLMLPALRKSGVTIRPLLDFRHPGIREISVAMLPMILGMSAVQLNVLMDVQIAWWLSPDGHDGRTAFAIFGHLFHTPMLRGAGGVLSIAQRIYMLPVGIFGVSLATALFPLMTKAANQKDIVEVKRLLVSGLRKTLFMSFPASAGMIMVALPLITVIYMGGKTGVEEIQRANYAAIWFCLGIWAFEAQLVILRVFYALGDTRTPMKIAAGMVVLNLALNLTLVWFLQEGGIALSTTIAASVQTCVLLFILRRRIGALALRSLGTTVGMSLLATVAMVEAGLLIRAIPLPWEAGGGLDQRGRILTALVKLPMIVAGSAVVYFAVTMFFGMGEVREVPVVGRVLRRFVPAGDRGSGSSGH